MSAGLVQTKDGELFCGACPAPYINALMEYSGQRDPSGRAINTGRSSRCQAGSSTALDLTEALAWSIGSILFCARVFLPINPTEQEIKEALSFFSMNGLLMSRWIPLASASRLLLALTLLQRALLPERPAFFVTAGQRGGGKTTLVHMIMVAILGRRAAAAAGRITPRSARRPCSHICARVVAALVWDNIARGTTISCPHIEAALTASEISDRVLGVSRVETVPASTVQIFTGNSIAPRGDMASRSFLLPLDVNRPDPENRTFAHADPLAWTQANRAKILRAPTPF